MRKVLIALFAALFAGVATAAPVPEYFAADSSPAFTASLDTSGIAGTLVVSNSGAGSVMNVILGTTTNVLDGSGTMDTVAEFKAALEACIYIDGDSVTSTPITVNSVYSLDADSTDGELLDGSYSLTNGTDTAVYFDTSSCKFYNNSVRGGVLKRVVGDAGGTGAITLSIYGNGSLVWNETLYEDFVDIGTSNQFSATRVNKDFGAGIYIPGRIIVRATRASTATTGGITTVVDR